MSGGDHGFEPVERNIRRRQGGTYAVAVSVDWETQRRSFGTLKEARAWRDEMIASRPKRMARRGNVSLSAHASERKENVRQVLAQAPRTTVERDGRVYTLISLPAGEMS